MRAVRLFQRPGGGRRGTVYRPPAALLYAALVGLLVLAVLLNAGIGAVRIPPAQVIAILLKHLGLSTGIAFSARQDAVLWSIRLPRIALAGLVGAGLAVSGATLQGVFRNPLADPSLIGVSSGAALGAVLAILIGFNAFGNGSLPAAAFAGGITATLVVYALSRYDGRTEVVTLILTGVALNAITGAGTGLVTYIASDRQLRSIVFWTLGSLGGATWGSVGASLIFVIPGLVFMPRFGNALNLLVLGENEARQLGVSTERTRFVLIALAALVTGATVAEAGIISFAGLVVPHLIRLLAGPDHRILLPACIPGGAAILLFADLAARTIVRPSELPLGVVTSLVGGPFFLWLLRYTRRRQGGWG